MAEKGQKKVVYTIEERRKISERVCQLYETQNATIASCCESAGVSIRAFNLWVSEDAEIAERYKKAKQTQESNYWENIIKPLAKTSLQRLLEGEETKDVIEKDLSFQGSLTGDKEKTVKRGKASPNSTAVIFALKGLYPDMFAERQKIESEVNVVWHEQPETITSDKIAELERILGDGKRDTEAGTVPGKRKAQG